MNELRTNKILIARRNTQNQHGPEFAHVTKAGEPDFASFVGQLDYSAVIVVVDRSKGLGVCDDQPMASSHSAVCYCSDSGRRSSAFSISSEVVMRSS